MNKPPGYGDAEAKRIIARAAEIDAEQRSRLDVPALREIAAEAGISSLAVERALEEHESTVPARAPWWKRHPALLTLAALVALFVFFAVMRTFPQ